MCIKKCTSRDQFFLSLIAFHEYNMEGEEERLGWMLVAYMFYLFICMQEYSWLT